MNPKKTSNPRMKEWPGAEKQFSEHAEIVQLMQTLPQVDANADEQWKRKRIEYASCLNFRR